MRILKWSFALAVSIYLGCVAVLYFTQRRFLFPVPHAQRISPAQAEFPSAEEHVLTTSDNEKVLVWHVPPREGKPVVLFFHGNGDILAWRAPRFRKLTADGTGLVALSYRGYAGSTGTPDEPGLLRDAAAAYDFTASRYPSEKIVTWGFSLGSGVATAVAAERPMKALILEAPYTSTVDVAAAAFPFVPVSLLMRDQFRSDQRIGRVAVPLLVMHGEHDVAISVEFGRRLYVLARDPKRLVLFPNGGHENLDEFGAVETVHGFISDLYR